MAICVVVNGERKFLTAREIAEFPISESKLDINIKKKNLGKFTDEAKAAGMDVQAYADKVLADPDASPKLKKRANFAKNAASWKH